MSYCPRFKRGAGTIVTGSDHFIITLTVRLSISSYTAVYVGFMVSIDGSALVFRARKSVVITRFTKFQQRSNTPQRFPGSRFPRYDDQQAQMVPEPLETLALEPMDGAEEEGAGRRWYGIGGPNQLLKLNISSFIKIIRKKFIIFLAS